MAAGALIVIVAANVWTGCTVTPGNYKTLSFFFDGVPDPSKQALATDGARGAPNANAAVFSHKPYFDQACNECHRARVRMSKNDSGICAKCHEGKDKEHAFMHGPVAANACLWCHHPHESTRKFLLRDEPRAMCVQCHAADVLSTEHVPEHADGARSCLDCHTGHGGSREFLLREVPIQAEEKPADDAARAPGEPTVSASPAQAGAKEGK